MLFFYHRVNKARTIFVTQKLWVSRVSRGGRSSRPRSAGGQGPLTRTRRAGVGAGGSGAAGIAPGQSKANRIPLFLLFCFVLFVLFFNKRAAPFRAVHTGLRLLSIFICDSFLCSHRPVGAGKGRRGFLMKYRREKTKINPALGRRGGAARCSFPGAGGQRAGPGALIARHFCRSRNSRRRPGGGRTGGKRERGGAGAEMAPAALSEALLSAISGPMLAAVVALLVAACVVLPSAPPLRHRLLRAALLRASGWQRRRLELQSTDVRHGQERRLRRLLPPGEAPGERGWERRAGSGGCGAPF